MKTETREDARMLLVGKIAFLARERDWSAVEQLIKDHEFYMFKAGMTRAAEIAVEHRLSGENQTAQGFYEAILNNRDALTGNEI